MASCGSHWAGPEQLDLNGDNGKNLGGRMNGKNHALFMLQTVIIRQLHPCEMVFGWTHLGGNDIEIEIWVWEWGCSLEREDEWVPHFKPSGRCCSFISLIVNGLSGTVAESMPSLVGSRRMVDTPPAWLLATVLTTQTMPYPTLQLGWKCHGVTRSVLSHLGMLCHPTFMTDIYSD